MMLLLFTRFAVDVGHIPHLEVDTIGYHVATARQLLHQWRCTTTRETIATIQISLATALLARSAHMDGCVSRRVTIVSH
jgi:hypothetical protein